MERRALLAFVASMVLFLAYDAIYLSPRVKKQQEQRRAQMELAARADSMAAAARGATFESPPVTEARESADTVAMEALDPVSAMTAPVSRFTVTSDLFEIVFTSAGGEIAEARLLRYTTDERPVEPFPRDPDWTREGILNLTLEGDGPALALGGLGFQAYPGGSLTPLDDGARVEVDPRREYTDLVFRAQTAAGPTIERTYRFFPDRYDFEATVRFARSSFPAVTGIAWGFGPGMTATEANLVDDQENFRASLLLGEEFHRLKPSHFSNGSVENYAGTLSFASLQTKYFLTAIVPPVPTRADVVVSGDKATHRLTQRVTLPAPAAQAEVSQTVRVYIGPLAFKALEPINAGLDRTIEMGWRWIRPVAWIVLKSMIWTYHFIPNYGWVIIIISVLTKVLFYRLTHKSFKSMKEMQELQPRIAALKEKFGDDRQRLSQETMKLYKEAGVNPLGGCLPMLLQMPVFVALFNVLKYTIEVRGAHFAGWINDLSQQDVLFKLPMSIPFIGDAFSLLPILMGVSMFMQSKLGGSPTGGSSMMQPPGMTVMLPVVFTVLFYKMPSGLVIYWIINTVLSVAQQYYIHRDSNKAKANDEPEVAPRPRRAKKEG
jgi:YidC/Oxa1 family membrane protein insertase